MLQYLVLVGAAVNLVFGALPYIKDTLKGKTKPSRVSWLMWSIAPLIGTVAAVINGVGWAVLPVFMAGFIPILVFISSFFNKDSYWKLEKFDYLCGFFSVAALILWAVTKNPVVAIFFSIVGDFSAGVPTLIKSWKHPETETVAIYAAGIFTVLTGFAAVKTWNFSSVGFLIYLLIFNIITTILILRSRFVRKNNL